MKIDTDDSGWAQYVIIDIEKDDSDNERGSTLEIVRNKLQVQKQRRELYSMNQHDKSSGLVTVYVISVFCLFSMYIGFLICT